MKKKTLKKRTFLFSSILLFFLISVLLPTGFGSLTKVQAANKGWKTVKGQTYYYNRGKRVTGWKKINGNYYYFAVSKNNPAKKGQLLTGWRTFGGKTYYLKPRGSVGVKGRRLTGWQTIQGKKFYFDKNGCLATGWKTLGGKTYLFKTNGSAGVKGQRLTGWRTVKGEKFYLDKNGCLVTGWKSVGSKKYDFQTSGKNGVKGRVLTGWQLIQGQYHYFLPSGKDGVYGSMVKNKSMRIGDLLYQFDRQGLCLMNETTQKEFIETIGKLAQKDMESSGILASITTAQAILESAYGTSTLAIGGKNLFGMKASLSGNTWYSTWSGRIFKKSTGEYYDGRYVTIVADFRRYGNYLQSIEDHSNYLRGAKNGDQLRYEGLVGCRNYRKAATIIKSGGYATDPNYVDKLCNLIETYDLRRFDK